MIPISDKIGFYTALYLDLLGLHRHPFTEVSDTPFDTARGLPQDLRVHFWTPAMIAGAQVNVYDVLPALHDRIAALKLNWRVTAATTLLDDRCDWLFCFKAVPDTQVKQRHGKVVMLICDQADVFWSALSNFDAVVATACRPLASVVASKNPKTFFIGETEPLDYLDSGKIALSTPPSRRPPVLMWHGGHYSLGALLALRPVLERIAANTTMELHVIGGQMPERGERWGALPVRFLPWSKQQLKTTAASARLGILPAREGARLSYLKPASRMRCLYALGVPAIADSRTPDAVDFAKTFGSPLARSPRQWSGLIAQLWNNPAQLDALALAGYQEVAKHYSTANAAERWIRFLGT